jgi:uncharacterized small protein (DUF1192 family)
VSAFLWEALGGAGTFTVMAAVGDMVSEEVRDRLDHLPHAILRLAAQRLHPDQRSVIYDDEWMPELTYILKGDEARPITRLYHGTRYAVGILATARRIAGRLSHPGWAGIEETEHYRSIAEEQLAIDHRAAYLRAELGATKANLHRRPTGQSDQESARWQDLFSRKVAELEAQLGYLQARSEALSRLSQVQMEFSKVRVDIMIDPELYDDPPRD